MSWKVVYTKQAKKDAKKISRSKLRGNAQKLIDLLKDDPYQNPPPYEELLGRFKGTCSRRINILHRLVYEVIDEEKTVKVLRMWTHYES